MDSLQRHCTLYNNYSKTRNLIGQYPCRMRQSRTRNVLRENKEKLPACDHFVNEIKMSIYPVYMYMYMYIFRIYLAAKG